MILLRMMIALHSRLLLAVLAVLLVLAALADFFERARILFSSKGTAGELVLLILYRLPSWLYLLLPVALLAGCCLAFAVLGRSSQLRALASAGIGPLRIALGPLLVTGGVVLSMFAVQECLVPPALDRLEPLMMRTFGRIDASWRFFRSHQWHQGDQDRLFRVQRRNPAGTRLERVTILEFDQEFQLERRTDLEAMTREGEGWVGTGIQDRHFDVEGRQLALSTSGQQRLDWLTEDPEHFRDLSGRPAQKTLGELQETITALEDQGRSAAEFVLSWHNRFAYPGVGVGLVLLAMTWLWRPGRRRTVSGALTEAAALSFAGYCLVAACGAAVSGGLLQPAWGAWLPVGAVLFVAAVLLWIRWAREWRSGARRAA